MPDEPSRLHLRPDHHARAVHERDAGQVESIEQLEEASRLVRGGAVYRSGKVMRVVGNEPHRNPFLSPCNKPLASLLRTEVAERKTLGRVIELTTRTKHVMIPTPNSGRISSTESTSQSVEISSRMSYLHKSEMGRQPFEVRTNSTERQ